MTFSARRARKVPAPETIPSPLPIGFGIANACCFFFFLVDAGSFLLVKLCPGLYIHYYRRSFSSTAFPVGVGKRTPCRGFKPLNSRQRKAWRWHTHKPKLSKPCHARSLRTAKEAVFRLCFFFALRLPFRLL